MSHNCLTIQKWDLVGGLKRDYMGTNPADYQSHLYCSTRADNTIGETAHKSGLRHLPRSCRHMELHLFHAPPECFPGTDPVME